VVLPLLVRLVFALVLVGGLAVLWRESVFLTMVFFGPSVVGFLPVEDFSVVEGTLFLVPLPVDFALRNATFATDLAAGLAAGLAVVLGVGLVLAAVLATVLVGLGLSEVFCEVF